MSQSFQQGQGKTIGPEEKVTKISSIWFKTIII